MEPQSIQKLLIGVACAGLGASAHFFLSGKCTPAPVTQAVAAPARERPKPAAEKRPQVRRAATEAEVKGAKVRPQREEPRTYVPRGRGKTIPMEKKKVQVPAC